MTTALNAGDLAITGFNFDNPDELSFVLLSDLTPGTEIKFTDNGVRNDGSFRTGEGIYTWTAQQDYSAGSVVTLSDLGNIAFSSRGDQIVVYQGSESNPAFIFALNSQGNGFQTNATSKSTSALPPGLVEGETALALNEIDNARYVGQTTGTKTELLAAISNQANWTGSNTNRQTLASDPFTVSAEGGGSVVFINEIHYDNANSDVNEGIEIAATAGTDLSGWTIELYNGNGGEIYDTINLDGIISEQQSGFGTKFFAKSGMQNGAPDGLSLVEPSGNVLQFLSYEGTLTATGGSAAGMTSTDIGISESGSTAVGDSLQLTGSGTSYEDFIWTAASPNTYNLINTDQTFGTTGGGTGGNSGGDPGGSSSSVHLTFGNPSGAITDPSISENYLLVRDQYAMSYNNTTRMANWVGWQLNESWLGDTPRQDDFRADPDLPASFFQVDASDYSGSGFDRGHITPSADRTASVTDNSNTFYMTNMMPQAPANNRGVWASFENHIRTLLTGHDVYLYAGGYGVGGDGSNGFATSIGPGITVTAQTWKTVLVVDAGETPEQVGTDDYIISIDIPNSQSVSGTSWQDYMVSVDELEVATGFDFFAELSDTLEVILESSSGSGGSNGGGTSSDGNIFINEIHYDNTSSDTNEGIEIAGSAGVNLDGWSLELYNGNGGSVYKTESLSGTIPNQDNDFGTLFFPIAGIQNGAPDGMALVDDNSQVVQFLSYEGVLTASGGSANGLTSENIGVSESNSTPIGDSLQLSGTGNSYGDFTWASATASTFEDVNTNQDFIQQLP